MNLRFWEKDSSAATAKNRLMLVLAQERSVKIPQIEEMKQEILAVVRKYTKADKISIEANSNQDIDTLKVEIILD